MVSFVTTRPVYICRIALNEGDGTQNIYLDAEGMLRTDFDDSEAYGLPVKSVEEARETADALWGWSPWWDLRWLTKEGEEVDE